MNLAPVFSRALPIPRTWPFQSAGKLARQTHFSLLRRRTAEVSWCACAANSATPAVSTMHGRASLLCIAFRLILLGGAAEAPQKNTHECGHACACTSSETAWQVWRTFKAARRMAVSLEQGALDSTSLEEAQMEFSSSIMSTRRFRDQCGLVGSAASVCANGGSTVRKSCGCRPHRLLNVTRTVSRRLDDAAAGVLFGDGEENMLKLSQASSYVLHSLTRVASELERLGKPCPAAARPQHGRGGRSRNSDIVEQESASRRL